MVFAGFLSLDGDFNHQNSDKRMEIPDWIIRINTTQRMHMLLATQLRIKMKKENGPYQGITR